MANPVSVDAEYCILWMGCGERDGIQLRLIDGRTEYCRLPGVTNMLRPTFLGYNLELVVSKR